MTEGIRRDRGLWSAVLVTAVVAVVAFRSGAGGTMTPLKAVLLGTVEGITEFLPISSTGHLLMTQRLIGLDDEAGKSVADTYAIAIQIGAILAVVALYRERLSQIVRGLSGRDDVGRALSGRLAIGFTPAAVVGLVFSDAIKATLFGPWPVIAAWLAGGLFLLWWTPRHGTVEVSAMTMRSAAIIGTAQIVALWPGVSRSLTTIVAALAVGMTMSAALEFSFLLGLFTLSAATVYDLTKSGSALIADYGVATPLLGALVAYVTGLMAARWLVTTLRTRPLSIFGWYRIAIAGLAAALIRLGVL